MRKAWILIVSSLAVSLGALAFGVSDVQAAKAYCAGGSCCGDAETVPGYNCTLSESSCDRGIGWCTEDCTWDCVPIN